MKKEMVILEKVWYEHQENISWVAFFEYIDLFLMAFTFLGQLPPVNIIRNNKNEPSSFFV